jgi:hypothetical protein
MGKSVGFPGAGPGDHEQRRGVRASALRQAVFDGPPLFRVQFLQVGRGHSYDGSREIKPHLSAIPVLFAMRVIAIV